MPYSFDFDTIDNLLAVQLGEPDLERLRRRWDDLLAGRLPVLINGKPPVPPEVLLMMAVKRDDIREFRDRIEFAANLGRDFLDLLGLDPGDSVLLTCYTPKLNREPILPFLPTATREAYHAFGVAAEKLANRLDEYVYGARYEFDPRLAVAIAAGWDTMCSAHDLAWKTAEVGSGEVKEVVAELERAAAMLSKRLPEPPTLATEGYQADQCDGAQVDAVADTTMEQLVLQTAYKLRDAGLRISMRSVCKAAGIDRNNLVKNYPVAAGIIQRFKVENKKPRIFVCDPKKLEQSG